LPEAWANLASVVSLHDFDYSLADQYLQKALSLDGRNALVFRRASTLAWSRGNTERAIELNKEALTLDPMSLALYVNIGVAYYQIEQYDEALDYFNRANTISPNFSQSNYRRGRTILAMGDANAALALFEAEPMDGRRLMGQAMAYWSLGREEESDAALAEFMTDTYLDDDWQPYIAAVLAYRGEIDPAFEMLEQAHEQNNTALIQLILLPDFKNLHSDPRWAVYERKVRAIIK